jgi:hypothetical protein
MIEGNYITLREIADILGLSFYATRSRITKAGIKPAKMAGQIGLYMPEDLEKVRTVKYTGRPRSKPTPCKVMIDGKSYNIQEAVDDAGEYYTIRKMADILGLTFSATRGRVSKAGIKPAKMAGFIGLYLPEDLEKVRTVRRLGRPRLTAEETS